MIYVRLSEVILYVMQYCLRLWGVWYDMCKIVQGIWYDVCKIVWGWASRFWPELWTIKQGGRTSGLHIALYTLINKYCTFYICTCTNLIDKYCTLQLQIGASRAPGLVLYIADCTLINEECILNITYLQNCFLHILHIHAQSRSAKLQFALFNKTFHNT